MKFTLTSLILLTAVFSIVTSAAIPIQASTEGGDEGEENDPEEEAEEAAEEGRTEVYDDNPDLDGDGVTTDDEYQKFQDAAVGLADRLNSQKEEGNDEDYTITCWNGEEVAELSDCPEDDGEIICNDGSTAIRISDCPTGSSPPPLLTAQVPTISTTSPPSAEEVSKGAESAAQKQSQIPFHEADEGFDPDESCLFDVNQPKCTPPEGVDCPEGFGTNEDGQCFPLNEDGDWECPEGYHSIEDDESGQCYPESESCPEGTIKGDDGDCISEHWCDPNREGGPLEECPDKERKWWECDVPWYMTCDSQVKKKNDNNKVIKKTTVINSATASASASRTATSAEVSSCRLDGSADGILQKFDSAKYQACGLYVEGHKAYSDGFVIGCTQVGNTKLICQAFADSNIMNMKTQSAQAATQPTQQGIQPAAVDK